MKFAINPPRIAWVLLLPACLVLTACDQNTDQSYSFPEIALDESNASDQLRIATLREAAIRAGLVRAEETWVSVDPAMAELGGLIFDSELLSLNGSISCRNCHLSEFGSADGIPNAVGVGGQGTGLERLQSGGTIVPRNALPLWGRGGKGFETFFWDGKVELRDGKVLSQFGESSPSNDPLVVAAHLPSVEIREMVIDDQSVREQWANEDVTSANSIYAHLVIRLLADPEIGSRLAGTDEDPDFSDVALALASFIRDEFRLRQTKFERFVFEEGAITQAELHGGILFYGRGRCSACHNGPYFSDMQFHAVAFPQAGFGKNGFGVDEGRFNVTFDPSDRFLFRTPPLFNVTLTAPYSHSGSVMGLEEAIIAHFDPLRLVDPSQMDTRERADLFQRLGAAGNEPLSASLTDQEVAELASFLRTLEFEQD